MVKSSTNVNFKLQNLRKENNISYAEMAKKVGICKAYYWQIENGNRRIYYEINTQKYFLTYNNVGGIFKC